MAQGKKSKALAKLRGIAFLTPVEAETERKRQEKERRKQAADAAKAEARDLELQAAHAKAHREAVQNAKALVDHTNADYEPPTSTIQVSSSSCQKRKLSMPSARPHPVSVLPDRAHAYSNSGHAVARHDADGWELANGSGAG
eukprot:749094-Prymnesium_polylepis.1